jgi:seryl-tRNA synthetase
LIQEALTIEGIIAQLEGAHKSSKRDLEKLRNDCRSLSQQGMDKESINTIKKMSEDVFKAHKQCSADLVGVKKAREEISEELEQGISKFGQ